MPRIVDPTDSNIRMAAQGLRAGGLIAFPTETVYGLGCDTFNPRALEHIFTLKGRPFDNPLIAHVSDATMARERIAAEWDVRCDALTNEFWPGPLTLVARKRDAVPPRATAGRDTIAVRCPDHPVARQLLAAFNAPISAPSANRSGHISPTTAEHVADEFADAADLVILDGGPCDIGIESTVLDMTTTPPRILRPGHVTRSQIETVIGEIMAAPVTAQDSSPGTRRQHYSPHIAARLLTGHDLRNEIMTLRDTACAVLALPATARAVRGREGVTVIEMPRDPERYARDLYAALRTAERAPATVILIESPPGDDDRWSAVLDRLRRATSP